MRKTKTFEDYKNNVNKTLGIGKITRDYEWYEHYYLNKNDKEYLSLDIKIYVNEKI